MVSGEVLKDPPSFSIFCAVSELSWGIHSLVVATQAGSFSQHETGWASAVVQLVRLKLRFLHLVLYIH